jgi:hypothetical protein
MCERNRTVEKPRSVRKALVFFTRYSVLGISLVGCGAPTPMTPGEQLAPTVAAAPNAPLNPATAEPSGMPAPPPLQTATPAAGSSASPVFGAAGAQAEATSPRVDPARSAAQPQPEASPSMQPQSAPRAAAEPGPAANGGGEDYWPTDCEQRIAFRAHDVAGIDHGKYRVPQDSQYLATFYFKAPWSGDMQLLKSRAILDNKKIVHHWFIWGTDSTLARDGEVRGTPEKGADTLGGESYIASGVPGGNDVNLPSNVGIRMPSGKNLLLELEIHYSNFGGGEEEDASGIELCITSKTRPIEAAVHSLGRSSFDLPPHVRTDIVSTCTPNAMTKPVHIVGVTPHMHLTGVHSKLVLNRKSGEQLTLLDKPFAFQDQRTYAMPEDGSAADVVMNPGDTLTSTCSYDNTTDSTISVGEHAEDEMCLIGVLAWPAGELHNSLGSLLGAVTQFGSLADVFCIEP